MTLLAPAFTAPRARVLWRCSALKNHPGCWRVRGGYDVPVLEAVKAHRDFHVLTDEMMNSTVTALRDANRKLDSKLTAPPLKLG